VSDVDALRCRRPTRDPPTTSLAIAWPVRACVRACWDVIVCTRVCVIARAAHITRLFRGTELVNIADVYDAFPSQVRLYTHHACVM
jgi:hypothetical protein